MPTAYFIDDDETPPEPVVLSYARASGENSDRRAGLGANNSDQLTFNNILRIGFPKTWIKMVPWGNAVNGGGYGIDSLGGLYGWGSVAVSTGLNATATVPTLIDAGPWIDVAAGNAGFGLAVKADNTLWGWGVNSFGQLGLGNNTNQPTPVQIGVATNWSKVSGGQNHSLAMKLGGDVFTCGDNRSGQLGNGSRDLDPFGSGYVSTFQNVFGGASKIYTGSDMSGALVGTTAYAWGLNGELTPTGAISDFVTNYVLSPTSIGGGIVDFCLAQTVAAITVSGQLQTRGNDQTNGDGLAGDRDTFSTIVGGTWVKVAQTFNANFFAIRNDGTLWGWGFNNRGTLGVGDTAFRNLPTQEITGRTDWNDIRCTVFHAFGLADT